MAHSMSLPNLYPPPPWRPRFSDFISLPAAHPYEPPAIIYQGSLETRAGSPLEDPLEPFLNPDSPLYGQW